MNGIHGIKDLLCGAYDGLNWYGQPLLKILDGVTATEAANKPISTAHSIWEIILHLIAWTREVARRLKGGTGYEPEGGDWPSPSHASDQAWKSTLDDLTSTHNELLRALDSFPEDRLSELVQSEREKRAGINFYLMLHGLVQHNVYHSGQIALMRKLIAEQTGGPDKASSADGSP